MRLMKSQFVCPMVPHDGTTLNVHTVNTKFQPPPPPPPPHHQRKINGSLCPTAGLSIEQRATIFVQSTNTKPPYPEINDTLVMSSVSSEIRSQVERCSCRYCYSNQPSTVEHVKSDTIKTSRSQKLTCTSASNDHVMKKFLFRNGC